MFVPLIGEKNSITLESNINFSPYLIFKKSINGDELLSVLLFWIKNELPLWLRFSPWTDPEINLVPFPDHETVFPILFMFGPLACKSILWYVFRDPFVECPFSFNSIIPSTFSFAFGLFVDNTWELPEGIDAPYQLSPDNSGLKRSVS